VSGILELRDVVKHYRGSEETIRALDGVNLTVRRGEMVALLGPSGSGKSTLLKIIAALQKAERGTIRFEGNDISTFSETEAANYRLRDLGFIYQTPRLMPRVSAVENASLKLLLAGMKLKDAQERAAVWLERVGLQERLHHTPERLSGGERQRVSIARALAGEARLILADEPTGNLDSTRSMEIVQLLRSVARDQKAAVLLVTHDLKMAAIANKRRVLRDGMLTQWAEELVPAKTATRSPTASVHRRGSGA